MGYYSTMDYCEFKSDYTLEEINKLFEKYKEFVEYKEKYFELYYYFDNAGNGMIEVVPDGEEYYAKHYLDDKLAEFISFIIKDGTSTELRFVGEDGASWGYYIERFRVSEMYVEWKVDERSTINTNELEANKLAEIRKILEK